MHIFILSLQESIFLNLSKLIIISVLESTYHKVRDLAFLYCTTLFLVLAITPIFKYKLHLLNYNFYVIYLFIQ